MSFGLFTPLPQNLVLISTKNLENLIPDFLMESSLFHLVITDIEGKILKSSQSFATVSRSSVDFHFSDFLIASSASEFNYSLELMLSAPMIRRHLLLDHPLGEGEKSSKIWWEFSVVTTPDMDICGIIGIGVGMQFLKQEMPWDNLVDVLGFGRIVLGSDLKVLNWDERISQWFDPVSENWAESTLTEIPVFHGLVQLDKVLKHVSNECKPRCFLIEAHNSSQSVFAALLMVSPEGYHLFLVPKAVPSHLQTGKHLIPVKVISTLPGSVFVLDMAGKLSQQNEAARNLGRIWKGRAYSEGLSLTFPTQPNRFSKLLRAIDQAKTGQSSDLELKLLMPDKEFEFWNASIRPLLDEAGQPEGILIQVFDMSYLKNQLVQVNRENERLRDLALSPSHILRGPLSSMIGLLELIDAKQLDKENQKLFGYLKPLAKELDHIIRQHAKKMSIFT